MEDADERYGGESHSSVGNIGGFLTFWENQTLNDEVITQNIEISALTQRNTALQADNSGLLQRWLDKMNLTAEEMNVEFENETSIRGDQAKNKGKEKEGFQSGEKV